VSAQSAGGPGCNGPAEILALLPQRWHEQFLGEYRAAPEAAHDVRQWRHLAEMLTRWRLRAVAYSDPGFEAPAQAARDVRPEDLAPLPGLADWR
jgi:uncharacterized protein DUF6247